MRKIISLFQRNYDGDRKVRDEIVPGAEWVVAGEGSATRKFDGTCCMVRDGLLYKRREVKKGKPVPAGFEQEGEIDEVTGNVVGWLPVGDGPEDKWHRAAFVGNEPDGTYELCGPSTGGGNHDGANPEGFEAHVLVPHGGDVITDAPRTYDALREYLLARTIEGIVWHHPDGRMVKIKRKDFPT